MQLENELPLEKFLKVKKKEMNFFSKALQASTEMI